MRLVHMPGGTHYFQDYGYERHPYRPLVGEEVTVGLLVEEVTEATTAILFWEVEGQAQPPLVGEERKRDALGAYFSFSFGAFNSLVAVSYQFQVKSCRGAPLKTKSYCFQILREKPLGQIRALFKDEDSAYAVFDDLTLAFDWANKLRLFSLDKGVKPKGRPVQEIVAALGPSLYLTINAQPFFWSVKRFTDELVAASSETYRLQIDGSGLVHNLAYGPTVESQHIVGLGQRFDEVDQKGNSLLCRVVERFTQQGKHTYLPLPFFMAETGVGWLSNTKRRLWFDATEGLRLAFDTPQKGVLTEEWWLFGSPQMILAQLHALTGPAALPPKWALGIWISANGWDNQQETLQQIKALKKHELPATAIVLEAWSDEQTFSIFNDAHYELLSQERPYAYSDFNFPAAGRWPDPMGLAQAIEKAGLNLVLWQIPVIKYEVGGPNPQLAADEAHAIAKGYCVMNDDGTPYRITDHWFKNSLLLDFTNPQAVKWWFSKRQYLIKELGVKGFKTDGGEFLFDDTALLFDGQRGETAHNLYPLQYAAAYNEFLAENGVEGVTFTRSGFTGAQKYPIHWAGDQLSTWKEFQAQLKAGLSAGLSGIPFWSFDLGGFAGNLPSEELYLRSIAMGAFAPIMQWHSEPRSGQFFNSRRQYWNNDRSPWNLARLYKSERIISIYRLFANLRMNLLPYIYQEARHAAATARPLMAHLLVDFPQDQQAWKIHDQYMFGRDLLVAPLVTAGAHSRQIYLPEGVWHDLFLGKTYQGAKTLDYPCPLQRIPVFVKDGAALPLNVGVHRVVGSQGKEGGVSNDLEGYTELAFLCFGEASLQFEDDLGTKLWLQAGKVRGTGPKRVLLIDALAGGHDFGLWGRFLPAKEVEVK